ncbi:UNVERIFIED_CONTAM: hypothetical protein HDU68_008725 [Siphonaria sp. JEL0065]|nr:hypothetical protein HDU68_008725 [Siphonaria sp. JEL0065]
MLFSGIGRRMFHGSVGIRARARVSSSLYAAQTQQGQTLGRQGSSSEEAGSDDTALLLESLPSGVSLGFYRSYLTLLDQLDAATPPPHVHAGLRTLAITLLSPQDASLFKDATARWRRHALRLDTDAADQALIADRLESAKASSVLLQLALNPFKYGLYLSHQRLHSLMLTFTNDFIESADEAALDNIYKSFALLLKSNVSPSANDYIPLVVAGAYGSGEEAWSRALTSVKEAEWLFGGEKKLPAQIYNALVAGYIARSQFQVAAELIDRISKTSSASVIHPRLRVEAFLMNGELSKSVNALKDLSSASAASAALYSEKWTPAEQVRETLLAELKEKDEALFVTASELLA